MYKYLYIYMYIFISNDWLGYLGSSGSSVTVPDRSLVRE